MGSRGQLTPDAQTIAQQFLGREITQTELRLYPYIQYTMMNSQKLDASHINPDEREILSVLRKEGHIDGGVGKMSVTREFWQYLSDILYETYVDIV
jgi:hypothetical protein